MLFKRETLEQIAAGRVTLAFRRWSTLDGEARSALRTARWPACDRRGREDHGEGDQGEGREGRRLQVARRAGGGAEQRAKATSTGSLSAASAPIRWIALRKEAKLTKKEMKSVIAALNRLDQASPNGAWTPQHPAPDRQISGAPRARSRDEHRPRPDDLQARRQEAEGARPDRASRGRLPALAARPRGAGGDLPTP